MKTRSGLLFGREVNGVMQPVEQREDRWAEESDLFPHVAQRLVE